MKPGYRSTEFWLSLVSQLLAFGLLLGFIGINESRMLEETLGKGVVAVFTLLGSAKVVIEYIRSRTKLKEIGPDAPPLPERPDPPPFSLLFLVGTLTALVLTGPVQAQPYLPWRHQVNERLRFQEKLLLELIAQKQQPAPHYGLPIPGEPKQWLPIPGEPKQKLPLEGDPKQKPPIEGEPRQPLPKEGAPKQELPAAPQRLSIVRALSNPLPEATCERRKEK